MKKIASLLIVSLFAVALVGCDRVEKGTQGIKESKQLSEKINKDVQNMQKIGEEEKKAADPADKEK